MSSIPINLYQFQVYSNTEATFFPALTISLGLIPEINHLFHMTHTGFASLVKVVQTSYLEVIPGEPNVNNGFSEFGLSDLIGFKGTDDLLSIIKAFLVVHGMH